MENRHITDEQKKHIIDSITEKKKIKVCVTASVLILKF